MTGDHSIRIQIKFLDFIVHNKYSCPSWIALELADGAIWRVLWWSDFYWHCVTQKRTPLKGHDPIYNTVLVVAGATVSISPGNYSSDHNRKWWHIKMYPCSSGAPSVCRVSQPGTGSGHGSTPHHTGTHSVSRDGTQLRWTLSLCLPGLMTPDMGVLSTRWWVTLITCDNRAHILRSHQTSDNQTWDFTHNQVCCLINKMKDESDKTLAIHVLLDSQLKIMKSEKWDKTWSLSE